MNKNKITDLIRWYEHLNQENLAEIRQFYAEETYFKDPFHEYFELGPLIKIYEDMFKKLEDPRFVITKHFLNEESGEFVLFWDFNFVIMKKKITIKGNTLFKTNESGLIHYHLDYWDSVGEMWMKTPLLGSAIKLIYKIIF